jgi:hypothetical protein
MTDIDLEITERDLRLQDSDEILARIQEKTLVPEAEKIARRILEERGISGQIGIEMAEGSAKRRQASRLRGAFSWLLWWRLDEERVARAVYEYESTPAWKSVRGLTAILIVASFLITTAINMPHVPPGIVVEIVMFLVLAVFILLGHRWAMVGAMALWTLEKGGMVFLDPSHIFFHVLWWAIFMHVCYSCYAVESGRRKAIVAKVAGLANQDAPREEASEIGTESAVHDGKKADDNRIYAGIAEELEGGPNFDKALWTRLFGEFDGDENRTKAAYIKRRAEILTANGGVARLAP